MPVPRPHPPAAPALGNALRAMVIELHDREGALRPPPAGARPIRRARPRPPGRVARRRRGSVVAACAFSLLHVVVPRPLRVTEPAGLDLEAALAAADAGARLVGLPAILPAAVPDPLDAWPQEERASLRPLIEAAAAQNQLPVRLIEAVIAVESGFDASARSRRGAAGLMQLMPRTARSLGVRDRHDPGQNIQGGARYLRLMLDRFDGDLTLALAAYNAGPTTVARTGGVPPNRETLDYVRRIHRLLGPDPLAS